MIGLRSKLTTKGAGKWASSRRLREVRPHRPRAHPGGADHEARKEHCSKLLHFHIGSQLTDILVVKRAVSEGARVYAKLRKMGLPIEYFDVGGGLAIDYVGSRNTATARPRTTRSRSTSATSSTTCSASARRAGPRAAIVSESGRAIVAHHSCVVMNVFGHIEIGSAEEIAAASLPHRRAAGRPRDARDPRRAEAGEQGGGVARRGREEGGGAADVQARACSASRSARPWRASSGGSPRARRHEPREEAGAARDARPRGQDRRPVHGNFSLFQSAPDHWAFDQLFPIVPLHRLRSRRRATARSSTSPATPTARSTGSSSATAWTRRFAARAEAR